MQARSPLLPERTTGEVPTVNKALQHSSHVVVGDVYTHTNEGMQREAKDRFRNRSERARRGWRFACSGATAVLMALGVGLGHDTARN